MAHGITRRTARRQLTLGTAGLVFAPVIIRGQQTPIVVSGQPVEITVTSVSSVTVRLTVSPVGGASVPDHHALARAAAGTRAARRRHPFPLVKAGELTVRFTDGTRETRETFAGRPTEVRP